MTVSINLATLLAVAGGLAVATLPSTASATCTPGGGGGGGFSGSGAIERPQYDAGVEYAAGLKAMKAGDFKLAKKSFDHVLSVTSPSAEVLYLAGLSRVNLSDWKGARKFLERTMKIDPEMTLAQQQLGITYAKLADMPKAKSMLTTLKASAERCAGTCSDADAIKGAIAAVSAAITA